ncbi:MAG: methylmalonyl-CoA mutase family protein [Desulfobacterales bacterium]
MKAVSKSAYERQKQIERQEVFVVGVNSFDGDNEINVSVHREVEATYDPELLKPRKIGRFKNWKKLKRERDGKAVVSALAALKSHAKDESHNLMPDICECVKNDVVFCRRFAMCCGIYLANFSRPQTLMASLRLDS